MKRFQFTIATFLASSLLFIFVARALLTSGLISFWSSLKCFSNRRVNQR